MRIGGGCLPALSDIVDEENLCRSQAGEVVFSKSRCYRRSVKGYRLYMV